MATVGRRCAWCKTNTSLGAVRDDIEMLGDLTGVEASLAQIAYKLAEAVDAGGGEDGKQLHALARELRATLKELTGGRGGDGDDLGDLGSPE